MAPSRRRRLQRRGLHAGIPVLCVGNYHVGGAGKTPTVLALAKLLRELGETPVVLSRGYGGKLRGPVRVDPARHAASDVGDEPLMLAGATAGGGRRASAPTASPLARAQGASVILMDDGFQNPAIAKDASLIVIDGERGLGNGQVFPAGPLARAAAAATRAHRCAHHCRRWRRGRRSSGRDRRAGQAGAARASEAGRRRQVAALRGKRVLAFAGIGDPARFFSTLRASGIDVVAAARLRRSSSVFASRDRKPDRRSKARRVDAGDDGKGSGAAAARRELPDWAQHIVPFAVTLEFDDAARLRKFVTDRLFKAREKRLQWSSDHSAAKWPMQRLAQIDLASSARRENAAAARRSGTA